jgi:hypothetical protein
MIPATVHAQCTVFFNVSRTHSDTYEYRVKNDIQNNNNPTLNYWIIIRNEFKEIIQEPDLIINNQINKIYFFNFRCTLDGCISFDIQPINSTVLIPCVFKKVDTD